ncbi:hypothetical protein RCL_jg17438.t1 [Rhizophagus clarus]|uniref:Uncharacterized protein n=1 Tax=Rhizophagus clarus TaxID=94130 RepID=A0A8H3LT39_9GLOM|nr:hypothetical protein RCL_jg17438.t1 [Rhizophagus clarus]
MVDLWSIDNQWVSSFTPNGQKYTRLISSILTLNEGLSFVNKDYLSSLPFCPHYHFILIIAIFSNLPGYEKLIRCNMEFVLDESGYIGFLS